MRFSLRSRAGAVAAILLAAAIAVGVYFLWDRGPSTPAELASYLPNKDGTMLYIDVKSMRRTGVLNMIAGTKAAEEFDYKEFVDQTNFDYRRDLDAVAATFRSGQVFIVARGHFDWTKIYAYAQQHGGACRNSFCAVDGSQPQRKVSFYRLRSNLLALATSTDDMAAYQIMRNASRVNPFLPDQPIWILVPSMVLKEASGLPPGTAAFAIALQDAERIIFTAGPDGDHLQLGLNVTCKDPAAASALLVQLEGTTNTLRRWLAREHQQPNARDLSGVLVAGSFRRDNRKVYGQWPLSRAFVESVTGGTN